MTSFPQCPVIKYFLFIFVFTLFLVPPTASCSYPETWGETPITHGNVRSEKVLGWLQMIPPSFMIIINNE